MSIPGERGKLAVATVGDTHSIAGHPICSNCATLAVPSTPSGADVGGSA